MRQNARAPKVHATEGTPSRRWSVGARRLAAAFAISVLLHGILAALWHPRHLSLQPEKATVVVSHVVTIEHRPKPTPRPPTVHPRHTTVIAPAHVAVATPGHSAPHRRVARRAQAPPRVRTLHHARPNPVRIVMGGQGAGAKTGKAPVGGAGAGGAGTGQGDTGSGSGAAASDEPCGYVEFVDIGGLFAIDKQRGGLLINIRMIVHFPDGHTEDVALDYPWYYPDQAANPWSDQNVKNQDFPVTFQWPPATKASGEPPLVKYVMQHTTRAGYTKLKDCPGEPSVSASPSAQPG